jgi:ribosomal-protein-alanine N-acetyltransferase
LDLLYRLRSSYSNTFLVAEIGGRVVGYVIGAVKWLRMGHVLAIAVDPPFQGRGIGSRLMEEVMRRFRNQGVRTVRLEVRKSNLMAQHFYRKLGFIERFEVPFYYEDGETAVAMERNL